MTHTLCLMFALAGFATACSQAPAKPDTTETAEVPANAPPKADPIGMGKDAATIEKPMLWVHRSEAGDVYLLGTVHIAVDPDAEFPRGVWDALDDSQTFVMETDISGAASSAMQMALLPEGRTLDAELGAEGWANLEKVMGPGASNYKAFKPWFIYSLLAPKMLPDGEDPSVSMDAMLSAYSQRKKMKQGYLEEVEFQLEVLSETITGEVLNEMTADWDNTRVELAELLAAYRSGDAKKLETLTFAELEEKPVYYEKLLFERNRNWAPQFENYIKEPGQDFIAVGAGHIVGKGGMLELMEERGYMFERVTFEKK